MTEERKEGSKRRGGRGALASSMAPMLRSSVLALSSTRPSLCSHLPVAQASAASTLGCVAALACAAALSLAAGSPCRRQLSLAAGCTRRHSWRLCRVASVLVLCSNQPSLCPPLNRCSSQRRLGTRLRRRARPRGGALARRRLAMPAAGRERCEMHAASLLAPVLRSSVLVLPSTRPSLYSPLTAARASAASALS